MNPRLAPLRLHALALAAFSSAALAAPASAATGSFAYTGVPQTWVVPQGVTEATFDIRGAQGGGDGGLGGRARATIAVTPSQSIQVTVGGEGTADSSNPNGSAGGFNGGGDVWFGGSGGGATDIRIGGPMLTDRVLVAGGGGGYGVSMSGVPFGGAGGGLLGLPGGSGGAGSAPGSGGNQTAGGFGGGGAGNGSLGSGGDNPPITIGGAGGGGFYGGGGGDLAGGGGGSGFGPPGTTFETGVRAGDGAASVDYVAAPAVAVDPPPAITDLSVVPRKFAPSRRRTALSRPRGATVKLTLSEDAVVRLRVRRAPPKRSGRRPPKNRRAFTRRLGQGATSIPLRRILRGGKTLKPHRYKLKAVATDSAGQRSDPAVTRFRVHRP